MEIQLTAVSPDGSGSPVDLAVRAPDGCTASQLWAPLCQATGHDPRGSARFFVDGDPIPNDAPLGAPPLVDGAVLSLGTPGMTSPRRVAGVLELHVVAGPDSGHVLRLAPGAHLVGRAAQAGLRLDDADISRVHAQLQVTGGGVTVADLGSTNGTWLDGSRLGAEPVNLSAASRLVVGSSTLALRPPAALPAAVQPDGAGHVAVNRSPRILLPPVQAREIRLPARPAQLEGLRLPMLATILPLVLSVVMAKLMNSPAYLLFGLMSPVMMVGSWFSDRRGGRHGHARRVALYERELAAARRVIADALREEGIRRRARQPDNALLMTTAAGPHARLWERRRHDDDVLHLRVGSSRLPSSVTVRDPDADTVSATPYVDDVPVCVPLPEVGVLGLAGPRDTATGLTRALLGQICGWHSPRDVAVHILAADAGHTADWAWAAHLPHTRPGRRGDCRSFVGILTADGEQLQRRVAHLRALVETRKASRDSASGRPGWRGERTVVLLDGAQKLRAVRGVSQLLEDGPSVGVYFICLDTDPARLPVEAHGTVHVVEGAGTMLRVELAGARIVDRVAADLVSRRWAERFARSLAPLRDATPSEDEGRVPDTTRLLDVLDFDATDAGQVSERWLDDPRTTRAVIGLSDTGPYAVDLCHDGPHALVGGTTGSGKSELLQTLIASLALGNRPDQISFVLIDYKGGSAFKDCARLPHTVGLVTDLDGHLTQRALTSLEAELRRRERILKALGAKDIEDYYAVAGPADPPLPRLVLVIDEFKMLVEDLPGFVDGLVKIAAVGRSLGVHLILATQRPGGIVSSDIRANVNLRIALRVRDRADSEDVLEAPDAASISETTPGRAYLRSGASPLVMMQAARVAGHDDDETGDDEIETRVLSWATAGDPQPRARPRGRATGSTDLQRIVDATRQAAVALGSPAGPSPWLPPLPDVVSTASAEAGTSWEVPYGLVDLPKDQAQHVLAWNLERDGHLAFAGTARTGRTSVLRTLAGTIARQFSPGDVHLYAFDGSAGGLMPLTALPHTGAVVMRDQLDRADRLVRRLQHELSRRQTWLGDRGLSCLAEQRAHATGEEPALPYLVLLIDGWDGLSAALETVDHGRPVDALLQILREGAACGVRAAVAGDRSVLLSRIASVIPEKLVLRMADTTDLLMAGIPLRSLPAQQPAGRALRTSDGAEIQLGLLTEAVGGPAQVATLAGIGRAAHAAHRDVPRVRRPFRVDALPGRIAAYQLAPHAHELRSPTWALVGVGGDDLSPVGIDLAERGGAALVAGPPGSGRSTTLATMARSLAQAGRAVVLVTARRSPLCDLAGPPGVVGCCTGSDGALLRDLVGRHPDLVAFADDAELLLDSPAEEVLVEMARRAEDSGGAVVCAGASSELTGLYRGITVEVRRHQRGVLLNPSGYTDGEVFGIRVSKVDDLRPGRGLLVDRASVTPIQVALPH